MINEQHRKSFEEVLKETEERYNTKVANEADNETKLLLLLRKHQVCGSMVHRMLNPG
jgi:hypothetical protein